MNNEKESLYLSLMVEFGNPVKIIGLLSTEFPHRLVFPCDSDVGSPFITHELTRDEVKSMKRFLEEYLKRTEEK